MIKNTTFILLLALTLLSVSCQQSSQSANSSNSNAPIKTGVTPVADDEIAAIDTDFGVIKIELYSNIAPKMVARFKELAKEGVYNGVTFHRINPNLGIIQGGDPLSKDADPMNDGTGKSDKPDVPAEFSDIPYDTGIVGAARSQDVNSANCQFYIMTKRQPAFDKRYTVFGKVIEGQNNVNVIAGAPTSQGSERPSEKIVIKSITIQKK
jgi:cyclophilin family peptidyl-prolyl cis-trans isomerase